MEGMWAAGFKLHRAILDHDQLARLRADVDSVLGDSSHAGIRNLAAKSAAVADFARSPAVRSMVEGVLGPDAVMVRSILFNKTSEANWQVSWHQDLSIAVKAKAEIPGFGPWSVKDNVPHVQPPLELLQRMLTLRLHLDDADVSNGTLMVIPGSHLLGRIPSAEAAEITSDREKALCEAKAGDVLLMRPLLLHASRKSTLGRERRIIHLEFSGGPLPPPLQWHEVIG